MTLEEIKQLKPGDEIFIRARFSDIDSDGDAFVWISSGFMCLKPQDIQQPEGKPKYDPCRLFRKGDKVRMVAYNGRPPYDRFNGDEYVPDETIFTVMCDEWRSGDVDLYEKSPEDGFQIHHTNLELVTPVKELEPYVVRHNAAHAAWSIYGPYNLSAVSYFYGARYPYTEATAKAAAEAECDRLNAEYRKEQNND